MARRRGRKNFLWIIVLLVIAGGMSIFFRDTISQKKAEDNYVAAGNEGELQVHFMDVGQGDATIIVQGEHAMLIDGGDNLHGWQVVDYLNYLGIAHLDYMIATHPDADHIGGLDTVLENISCDRIMMPEVEKDTASYEGLIETMEELGMESSLPQPGEEYSLGTATFTVLAPDNTYENINDNSIAIRLVHGGNSFLFTGDGESEAESQMLQSGRLLASDVYKVAHHGSSGANTELFLMAVNPEYAVISCGEDNDYGHPHSEVLNRLRLLGTKIFRTDEQGTIVVTSDGSEITFNMSPTDSWQTGN